MVTLWVAFTCSNQRTPSQGSLPPLVLERILKSYAPPSYSRFLQHVARSPPTASLTALAATMTSATASDAVDMAMSHEPKVATPIYEVGEKQVLNEKAVARSDTTGSHHLAPPVEFEADLVGEEPTAEELVTLRRVSGKIPWIAFTIAFVELCERFGYYGCQVLCECNSRPYS
jgi:hypothetical protein